MYAIVYTTQAAKDIKKIKKANLASKAKSLIELIRENPYQNPPSYEKLCGNLQGAYSRRINVQHRLVYEVIESKKTIKIISLYNHYPK